MDVAQLKSALGKNISALNRKSCPVSEKALDEFRTSGFGELIRTKDGNYTCRVTVGNVSKLVNSAYKPWEEAKKQLLLLPLKRDISSVCYLGTGLGYHLKLLLGILPPESVVHLFERDLLWLFRAFSIHDFSEDIVRGRLRVKPGESSGTEDLILSGYDYVWEHPVLALSAPLSAPGFTEPAGSLKRRALVVSMFDYGAYRNLSESCAGVFEDKGWQVFHCGHNQGDIEKMLRSTKADIIFSLSFSLTLSMFAIRFDTPYISWELDKNVNPDILNPSYISSNTSVFTTYYDDVKKYLNTGAKAYFLPAAPNILLPADYRLTDEESVRYACDISFVGSPLVSTNNEYSRLKGELIDIFRGSDPEAQREIIRFNRKIDSILEKQNRYSLSNTFRLYEIFDQEMDFTPSAISVDMEHLRSILAKECCRFQRYQYLRDLAPLSVDIYGNSDWRTINERNFCYRGEAGFDYESGKIYRSSKINLDITRIYTLDGFSDRVFNVLFSGGFLLMNRTYHIESFFEDGRELVLFDTPEDLKEKCLYYLNSEKERADIAQRGEDRVRSLHSVESRVTSILAEFETTRGLLAL